MEMAKETLCINKLICEKKELLFIEGDMIVPDSKPDILNAICASGTVCVYKKEISDEKLRIDGSVNTYIMYLADNNNIRGLNTNVDFSETINLPNCMQDMNLILNLNAKSIECKVINERKIGIKITLEANIKVYSTEDVSLINNVDGMDDIQTLKETIMANSVVGTGSTKIYAKDTININNTHNLAEILKSSILITDKDTKISYNKVLTKAETEVQLVYLTEDNLISSVTAKVPVVGFLDMPNITDNNICDVNYAIKNLILKPNQVEEHSIMIEIEIEVSCIAYEEKELNLIQDMYSTTQNLEFNQKQISIITGKQIVKNVNTLKERVNVSEIQNKTVINIDATAMIEKEHRLQTKIVYEGEVSLNILYMDTSTNALDIKTVALPYNFEVENIDNDSNINSSVEIKSHDFIIQDGGNIDTSIDMDFITDSSKTKSINVINDLIPNGEREEQDYSIIVYIVKPGDSLWKIAKRFGTTVDDIARVNGIEDKNKILSGTKLYIPRYVKTGGSSNNAPMVEYA